MWQAGRCRQSIGVNSRARALLFAWVQRGSLAHTVGGRGWLAGEHVSAADRQHHARTRWGSSTGGGAHPVQGVDIDTGIRELHRRWGPPLSTVSGLTRRQQPHTWWGVSKTTAMTRVMEPSAPQVMAPCHQARAACPRPISTRAKPILFLLERCVMYTESLRGCPGFLGGFVGVWFCLSSLGWPWIWCVCSV